MADFEQAVDAVNPPVAAVLVRSLLYLASCIAAGMAIGRAFGMFARASFHYPLSTANISATHRAVLALLDAVEWPSLFVLTMMAALGLWRWLRPLGPLSIDGTGGRSRGLVYGACLLVIAAVALPATRSDGTWLAIGWAVLTASVAAWAVRRFWREACAAPPSLPGRIGAQVPIAGGHLAVSVAAAALLGYRGESSLWQTILLGVALAVFAAELVWVLLTAVAAHYLPGVKR